MPSQEQEAEEGAEAKNHHVEERQKWKEKEGDVAAARKKSANSNDGDDDNENNNRRNASAGKLEEVRRWVRQQRHLRGVRTDESFLLRFLHFQKSRVPDACAVIDRYLHMRSAHPEWFRGLDVRADPKLRLLMSSGYLLVLPGRDPRTGRRVMLSRPSAMDTAACSARDVMRAHILAYETLLCDEGVQERGLTYVFDEREVNWRHLAIWSPGEISKAFSCCERALPLRHSEIHFVHLPWTMHLVFQFAKSLLSQKLRDRFRTHCNFDQLSEDGFPCHLLPEGYPGGGPTTLEEMVTLWLAELEGKRDLVLGLDEMSYVMGAGGGRGGGVAGRSRGGGEEELATAEAEEEEEDEEEEDGGGVLGVVGSVRKMENGKLGAASTE